MKGETVEDAVVNLDPRKHVMTVWKDGHYKVWGTMDAFYARSDPDWLMEIGVAEIIEEMAKDANVTIASMQFKAAQFQFS